jgi:hypothetical protein
MVGNSIVSTNTTYTTNAYADTTYTAVFAEKDSSAFTVTFVDQYGNVVKTVKSTDLPLNELPEAPAFAGVTFKEWSSTLEEVNALDKSATVYASYENSEVKSYTINATGCTITVDGSTSTDTATATYNSKVTVTPSNSDVATSWSVNGSVASYASEYSFFCGTDVTLTYTTDSAVSAEAKAIIVSTDKTDTYRVKFLASRSVPAGTVLVESGFIYGKAMAQDDLVLENVGAVKGTNSGTVKLVKSTNTSADGQFALTYGVSAQNQNACARAYLICKTASGASFTVYSDASIYKY